MNDIYMVKLSKKALKDLQKMPLHIAIKLQAWVHSINHCGLYETRKTKGYHDEPLKGLRASQRSIRLNKAYRAIYTIEEDGHICFVDIIEVTKHEY